MQQLERNWRSIILFGRNVASYKFALAKVLLDASLDGRAHLALDELAAPYAEAICEHLKLSDKQATSPSSRFLDTCRAFNGGQIGKDELLSKTVALGFNNVINAFHVVNQGPISIRFFIDERESQKRILLTDELHRLREGGQGDGLGQEVEARWRLVETAWDLGISRNIVSISADAASERLHAYSKVRRVDVTSIRDALNGYQQGRCFYCSAQLDLVSGSAQLAEVDHFVPWVLEQRGLIAGLNGVWNLVLACADCNRGEQGKFARVPSLALLERLHRRNEYLILSHHPLRETLIRQTGTRPSERTDFLNRHHREALGYLHHQWEPAQRAPAAV